MNKIPLQVLLRYDLRWCLLVGLCIIVAIAYWSHPRGEFTTGGLVHGDGLYHYALMRSLVFDRDFDLSNDYELLGNPYRYGLGPKGIPINRFSLGPALIWAPFFLLAHAMAYLGNSFGWLSDHLNGCSGFYQRIALMGSPVSGVLTVMIAYREVAICYRRDVAIFASVALVGATPWFWYIAYQPSYSHAASGFSIAVVVWLWSRLDRTSPSRWWFLIGLAIGLAMLMRAQNITVILFPAVTWISVLVARFRSSSTVAPVPMEDRIGDRSSFFWPNHLLRSGVMLLGIVIGFSPQMMMWQAIYGQPILIPQGAGFMHWDASKWSSVLWSTRNGLFAFHPLLLFATMATFYAGLRGRLGKIQWIALALLASQAYINGSAYDWWAGWSFGGRRFLGLSLFFALFTACLWPKTRLKRGAAIVMLVAAIWFNVGMMHDYFFRIIHPARSVAMAPVWSRWFGAWTRPIHTYLGHPGSWPVNWLFAIEAEVKPSVFDRVSGRELARFKGFERGRERVNLHRFGVRGFEKVEKEMSFNPKWIVAESRGGRLTLALPLRRPYEGVLSLRMVAERGENLRLKYNGEELSQVSIRAGFNRIRLELPHEWARPGINILYINSNQLLRWDHPVLRVN